MSTPPPEAEKLLAVSPEEFVPERTRLAHALRDEGRAEDAEAVAALRKPPAVVLAVNRAARDRPQAARDAADAAERVRTEQLSGDLGAYRAAAEELERALALLAEVAVARLSRGKPASDAMRRRVSELLRSAVADDAAREALVRGALVGEEGVRGFEAYAGVPLPARRAKRASPKTRRRETRAEAERRARDEQLKEQIAQARDTLRAAEGRVRDATRDRDAAAKALAALEAKRDRA